jgi:N-acetyl-gamma-glutamyl-phosphate reductase
LPGSARTADFAQALQAHYANSGWVKVIQSAQANTLNATALMDQDGMELHVFGNDDAGHTLLVARLDNLGKGASGAAVQNLRLMFGL